MVPWPAALPALLFVDAAVLGVALVDLVLCLRAARTVTVALHAPRSWSLDRKEELVLELQTRAAHPLSIELGLDLPRALVAEPPVLSLRAPPRARLELRCHVRARERGTHAIGGAWIGVVGPLGLVRRRRFLESPVTVRVYPDLRQLVDYELLARSERLWLVGIRRSPRLGGDTEFEQLRDYQTGDPLSALDWKATARRDQLTVRAFRSPQRQSIVLVVDSGRLMAARHAADGAPAALSLLDRAIDACLLLAHVAVRQGDRVGLLAYDEELRRYLPPEGGAAQVRRIAHALHDLQASRRESRHDLAALQLLRRCRTRSLVVHCTSVIDATHAKRLERHLLALRRRHLPLAALLRDRDCFTPLSQEPHDSESLNVAGAASWILLGRARAIEALQKRGVDALDCFPEDLGPELVTRYLRIKAAHRL